MVDPSSGMILGCGVSAQPKLMNVPDTVAPCSGVSMVPNGLVAWALAHVIVREAEQRILRFAVLRVHGELIGAVALVRQHVGQHHEAPAAARREWICRECRLHVGARAVDEHRRPEIHLRCAGAQFGGGNFLPAHRLAADVHAHHLDVVDRPARERHRARHAGRVVRAAYRPSRSEKRTAPSQSD